MAEQESDPGFRVTDRRRRAEEETTPEPRPTERAEGRADAEPGAPSPPPPAAGSQSEAGPGGRNLIGLFVMLANFAMAALEGLPDPATGQLQRDPEQAAELIDLLMLLREKTEGRRTAEETQALESVIYELQLRYVRSRTGS